MVDLPRVQNNVPQLRAPTSPVSPGQIAQPQQELARNFEQAGDILMKDVAQPLAKRAGIEAVTRDAEGGLQVERLPIVGPAAVDFENAVQWSALAQSSGEARRMDLELARQHQNDPQSYLKAADEFKKSYVDKITKSVGPEVGTRLGAIIDSTTTQQYSSLLAQHQAMIKRNFDRDTMAVINDAKVDLDNLIEVGGLNTTVGAQQAHHLIERIRSTYGARVSNPVLGAPAEEADIAIKKLDQGIGGAMFGARVKKVLDDNPDDGVSKAEDLIDRNFNDTSIPASQRVANRDRAQDAIKTFTQDRVRAANVAKQQQKAIDDEYEDRVIRSTAPGGEDITEADVKKSNISPSAKIKMLGYLKREGMPEPLARVSHETSMDLLRRIRTGEMGGNGELYDAYDAGKLSKSDLGFLQKEFDNLRTPAGERLNKAKADFFRSITPTIDKSNPLMGRQDQDGKLQLYRLEWDVNRRMEEYRNTPGKNPYDLLDPSKPEFMGNPAALLPYQKSMAESIQDMTRRLQPRPAPAPAATPAAQPAAPNPTGRRPGETPDDYLKRMGIR